MSSKKSSCDRCGFPRPKKNKRFCSAECMHKSIEDQSFPVHRPDTFEETYTNAVFEYIRACKASIRETGEEEQIRTLRGANLPTVEGLVDWYYEENGALIHKGQWYRWAQKHNTLRDALGYLKNVQKLFLVNHSLNGLFNANSARFMLMNNHGMSTKKATENKNTNLDLNAFVKGAHAKADEYTKQYLEARSEDPQITMEEFFATIGT